MLLEGPRYRDWAEFIPDMMVVGIGTKPEVVPDAVMGELHLGSGGEIAGKQGEHTVGAFLQLIQ